jgi:type I restriction enzyme M protein
VTTEILTMSNAKTSLSFISYQIQTECHICFDKKETERFKAFTHDELLQRDKVNVDIFWLKDESLEVSYCENLPGPETIAKEIAENLESALEQ